ncbi:hypothetical protein [Alysiella crassa]|nr:hypothetical protein [Alysiella crassa]
MPTQTPISLTIFSGSPQKNTLTIKKFADYTEFFINLILGET